MRIKVGFKVFSSRPAVAVSLFWLVVFTIPLGLAAADEEIRPAGGFLALICHQSPERCPVILGHRFGLCSRCLGIHIGSLLACLCAIVQACRFSYFRRACPWFLCVLLVPLAVDVVVQWITHTSSSHLIRATTGILYGTSLTTVLVLFSSELLARLLLASDLQRRKLSDSSRWGNAAVETMSVSELETLWKYFTNRKN